MMHEIIVGLNLGLTSYGKSLADGAVAVMIDGEISSVIAEERIIKKKHSGGFEKSLYHCLSQSKITNDSVNLVVVSSCCDTQVTPDLSYCFPKASIISCNHHTSHALSSHCSSQFQKSISIVLDGGGNILSNESSPEWWKCSREQQSYYIVENNSINLISRDFESPFEMGFGETFRAFTKFLGLGGSENAGKLMALAAYGDAERYKEIKIFQMDSNGIVNSALRYSDTLGPSDAEEIVKNFLIVNNITIPQCFYNNITDQFRADIAAWIQRELELIVYDKVCFLSDLYPDYPICISGGVAYNCRNNGHLLNKMNGKDIFFSPFAGDLGQCIGNVCFGRYHITKKIESIDINGTYLGTPSNYSFKDILSKFSALVDFSNYIVFQPHNIYETIARLLILGKVGALHEGRSEVGPRALGNRSILARGDCSYIRDRVNDIKERGQYMPLAPVLLDSFVSSYFHISECSSYSYMTAAVVAKTFDSIDSCGFLHKDGSARIQVVRSDSNSGIARVLQSYSALADVPVIINTSFNQKNKPISEDLDDSVKYFCNMSLDFLAINGVLVVKDNGIHISRKVRELTLFGNKYYSVDLQNDLSLVSNLTDNTVSIRNYFVLFAEFCRWFEDGKKTTTIRHADGIDFTLSSHLPLYENDSYLDDVNLKYLMHVHIVHIDIKLYNELTESDAKNDGFATLEQLKNELLIIYGDSVKDGLVTIYHIRKSSFHLNGIV
jgi:carbamoyltransferase